MAGTHIDFRPFGREELESCVRDACAAAAGWQPPDQVRYLYSYLNHAEMNAQTIVVESPYIDRHYLAEFQGYYSTAFRPPRPQTVRLHFFSESLTAAVLSEIAEAALTDEGITRLRDWLQDRYLGFVVVRPLPSAPVGRTVLRPYRAKPARLFGPVSPPHRVHLFGVTLKAYGVQFHQQDRAVGACATAALASAMAAVTRRDGGRAPTTLAITEQANRSAPEGRVLPAIAGLTRQQMIGAMIAAGYAPDVVKPLKDDPALLMLAITTYVRSGIPVVMQLGWENGSAEGHAVTVVGFRESDAEESAPDIMGAAVGSYRIRARGVTKLYVHDDRLGPYARVEWSLNNNDPSVRFIPYAERFPDLEDPALVFCILAPLYPKIRMCATEVLVVANQFLPFAVQLAGVARRDDVYVTSEFRLAGDYVEEMLRLPIGRVRAAKLLGSLSLSRYVSLVRFRLGDDWLLDVVCDATDIRREVEKWGMVLAVIPRTEDQLSTLTPYFTTHCPNAIVG